MTPKRFRVNGLVKYNYSEIGEYIDENHTDRPLRNDILVELLNELHEENDGLKKQITSLRVELNTHKHPLWSTREAERKVSELTDLLSNETKKNAILLEEINSLRKENMRLKEENRKLKEDLEHCANQFTNDGKNVLLSLR